MFFSLVGQEVRYRLQQLSTHVYFLIFFGFGLLMMSAMGGAFGDSVTLLGSGPNTNANSPYTLNALTWFLGLFGMIFTAPFMGQAVYRDYDSGIHPLTFTSPVTKAEYLGGRFVGSYVAHLYLYAGLTGGLMLGTVVPWVEASNFGAFSLAAYLQPWLTYLLPNLLWAGGLFFVLPALARTMLPNYIGGVLLFMGYNIASTLLGADALENSTVASLVDPFGFIAVRDVTRYWTVAEQNSMLVPIEGTILYNRLLWLAVGAVVLGVGSAWFRFSHLSSGSTRSGDDEGQTRSLADVSPTSIIHAVDLPQVSLSESWGTRVRQFWTMTTRAFLEIVRDVYFYAVVGGSLIFLVVNADQAGSSYGTPVEPVTYHILDALSTSFTLFMVILIAFYAGELVWRERDLDLQQVHDAMPLPTALSLGAKATALGLMSAVLMLVVLVTGVGTQLVYGFTDIDVGLYLTDLYAVEWVYYLLISVLALTVHAVVNHKYLGHFVMVAFFLGLLFSGQLGLEHNLFKYGSTPGMPYSAMNGYGHFTIGFFWYNLLWAAIAVIMAVLARLAWVRGEDTTLAMRLAKAGRRLSPALYGTMGAAGVLALGVGGYIYVNTTVWNTFRTQDEQRALAAQYEKTYEDNASSMPQPRIAAADLTVDIYPDERDARLAGQYTLVNDHARPVDTLHVEIPAEMEVRTIEGSRNMTPALVDDTLGVRLLHLPTPLAPGDSMTFQFDVFAENRGFADGQSNTSIVYNGTFMNSGLLPHFGYDEGRELSDRSQREERGLDAEPRMASRSDTTARMRPYVSRDATWLDYEATVSTDSSQIALAPGTRDSSWIEDGRRYAHFRTTAPTLGFFSFLSADYAVKRTTWTPADSSQNRGEPVDIELYYHPTHDYNIGRMIESVTHSLDYYTTHFGPYQSEEVRIAEFPRYASFAQSFLGTIPYSEGIGFIARVDPETNIDYPYYITAHEMGHQWWAHQVVSGPVWGATMLVETLAQYSALMVMEEAYGRKKMKRFLEYELDQYLIGRAQEQRAEKPLMDAAVSQGYIHYRRGSLTMYALKEYLGEETVNRVLRDFLADHKYESPPFVTSEALVRRFEAAAPDSLRDFVGDLFREITLYENRAVDATYTKTDDGRYRVKLTVKAKKLQADSLGTEQQTPIDAPLPIGVFAKNAEVGADEQKELYLRKHNLTEGEQTVTVTVDEKPARAGIDPYVTLVDRNTDDNLTTVSQAESGE